MLLYCLGMLELCQAFSCHNLLYTTFLSAFSAAAIKMHCNLFSQIFKIIAQAACVMSWALQEQI